MCRAFPFLRIEVLAGLLCWVLVLGAAGSSTGRADTAQADADPLVGDRRLSAVVSSQDYREALVRYLTGYETWVGPCPKPQIGRPLRTLILKQTIPFPGVPVPNQPQWIEVVRISGCARPYERVVYATLHEGRPVFFAQLLGSTKAQLLLQHRTIESLVEKQKTAAVAAGCPRTQPVRILTTAFVSDKSGEYGRAWRETWTVVNCRGAKDVAVDFTPVHTGAIAVSFDGVPSD